MAAESSAVGSTEPRGGKPGFVEQTLSGISSAIERAVFTEEHARTDGWLQSLDARAKIGAFVVLVLAASLSQSLVVLVLLYLPILLAARASRLPSDFFVKRVWLGIPLFAGIVVLPAIFFVQGPALFSIQVGPILVAPTIPGIVTFLVFVARVGVCVSLAVLLVMTTPWAQLLKALRALHVPQVFVLVLSMAYRYIFLFLHTANGYFEARRSRIVARTSAREQRTWIAGTVGSLAGRSFKMSNDVYAAMLARGFTGEMRTYAEWRMRRADAALLAGSVALAVVAMLLPRVLP
jgi:cobalt/nickel transport system permease protein